ncbi:MAG: hypothetical protein IJG24_03580 [Selenomonadaceae bacterium]|nr:hypothetical protein [Selenomonadaceae bacterium]
MEHLQIVSYLCAILGAIGTAVVFVFVRPLDQKIDRLERTVSELSKDQQAARIEFHQLKAELQELRYAVQKAHDRIDAIVGDKSCGASKN